MRAFRFVTTAPQAAPPASALAIVLALAVVLAGCRGCVCAWGGVPAEAAHDFGDVNVSPPSDIEALAYLTMARAILDGREPPPATPPGAGRRVVLALWRGGEASVATANGPTLAGAVASAATSLAKSAGAAAGRLELDVPTALDVASLDEDMEVPVPSIGLEGVLVIGDDGKTSVVLPGEIVQRGGLFHDKALDHAGIAGLLSARSGVAEHDLGAMRVYRFRASAHVESPEHDAALPIVRGMVEPPPEVSPGLLLSAVRRGADYLTRTLGPSGRYVYMYHPADERDDASYGLLRHAGTTYALFEAYQEFGNPAYLEKGELALRYLANQLSRDPASQGQYVVDSRDEEQQKVGGAGLALLAFAEHAVVARRGGVPPELDIMRSLARFILKQQYEDGHFRCNADVERETGKKLKRELWYYPGEAVLGLLRLHEVDPQDAYLDGAKRGADWVVRVRDANVSEDNLDHDHWMSYAFDQLYRLTRDDAYLDHAYAIARAIQKTQHRAGEAPAPDFVGAFYDAQTTPGSTRLEAYDSDIRLSRFAGKPDGWLVEPAKQAARSMLGQQYRADDDYWLKNPARADGAVRESPFVPDVRIDYVQHAMCAWLHLARILRDPAYGAGDAR
jgi:hypothetical protein